MNQVLINDKGELIVILQEVKEPQENEFIVPLDSYYEVFNEQRYDKARWDFNLQQWVGVGEQRPIEVQPISETQKLWDMIDYMLKLNEIIPSEV